MKLTIRTAEQVAAEELAAARDMALADLLKAIGTVEESLIGQYPAGERQTWPLQIAAATAVLAGTETAAQTALLQERCAITSETVSELATKIATKAAALEVLAMKMSGIRDQTKAAIVAASDVAGVDTALAALATALAAAQP